MKIEAEIGVVCPVDISHMIDTVIRSLGERHGMDSASELSKGTKPANTWILDYERNS